MRMRLLLVSALVLGACASKKSEPVEDPQAADAPPNPEDFAPPEDHEPEAPPPPADPYADFTPEQKLDKAKELYGEAEGLAGKKDWENAMIKYEEAYYLVPDKHGFAFKVGQAAHKAGHCAKAEQYLQHFQAYGDKKKHAKQLKQAKAILAKTAGCASE